MTPLRVVRSASRASGNLPGVATDDTIAAWRCCVIWFARFDDGFKRHPVCRARPMSFVGFYDSILRYATGLPLPFRGRLHRMGLRGSDLSCWVRLGYSDGSMFEDICVRGIYDAVGRAALKDIRLVVDLGANVGVTVRLWAQLYPGAKIIAVEPDESNFEMCQRNRAPDETRIELIRGFVAGQSGQAFLKPGLHACTHTMSTEPGQGGESIRAFTLPEIIGAVGADQAIDLLKCDIEGAERELFADCSSWIGRVRQIVIELHTPYTAADFLADLARGGSLLRVRVGPMGRPIFRCFI